MLTEPIRRFLEATATSFDTTTFNVQAFFAILLVSIICGLVSPLVVGSRMAFFSDALSHTALAGIAIGVLILIVATNPTGALGDSPYFWTVPLVMVVFGALVGLAIAYFREVTNLSNDAIIGVFFALATGFGAMLIPELNKVARFEPEGMLFGAPYYTTPEDFLFLIALLLITVCFLGWRFNTLVFGGFNPTLARSRGMGVRLSNYLFIILLALVVNFSIKAVGLLLINAMLVVPAAAAANIARNTRQMFWISLIGCVACGLIGYWITWRFEIPIGSRQIQLRPGGTIVVLTVLWFFLSIPIGRRLGRRSAALTA